MTSRQNVLPTLGLDLGGTKIEGVVLSSSGDILARMRCPTPQADGYIGILDAIAALVHDLEQAVDSTDQKLSIGIGTPGSLSLPAETLKNSNTVCLNGKPLKRDLESKLNRSVRLANDANCFALAEAKLGAGRGADVVFGVILGTGVGGGLVFHGQVHIGQHGIGGEWGHNPLESTGPACYCGRFGCVETFLSGPGMQLDYANEGGDAACPPTEIAQKALAGESAAARTFERYVQRLGRGLATVINIVDPDILVLGGGLSRIDALYDRLPEALGEHVFSDEVHVNIVPNLQGDSAGVLGAAMLAQDNLGLLV